MDKIIQIFNEKEIGRKIETVRDMRNRAKYKNKERE